MGHSVLIQALPPLRMIPVSILCICLVIINPSQIVQALQTDPQDVEALKLLHGEWSGNPVWDFSTDPCTDGWQGIRCGDYYASSANNNQGNRVTSMLLANLDLNGTLHPAIGNLSSLLYMDLSSNPQLGGQLPSEIGNLKQIKRFYVISCNFSGSIPTEIGDMTPLEFLGLANNSFTGPLPNSVGNLVNLKWFDVSDNLLSGELPVSSYGINGTSTAGLDNLTNAEHIHIQSNRFSGIVPPTLFSSNMKLRHLLLAENEFAGPIPPTVNELPYLDIIRLDSNKFNGSIPSTFTNMTNIITLQLDNNTLSGQIPDLSGCISLRILTLGSNGFDASEIPSWIMKLGNLSTLSVDSSNLSGAIPQDLFAFSQTLTNVSLAYNQLNGTLDLTSPNLSPLLVSVDLTRNDITDYSKGDYNRTLLLSGNPACIGNDILEECQSGSSNSSGQTSSLAGDSLVTSNCTLEDYECPTYYRMNPKESSCICVRPVVAVWTFYAMKTPELTDMPEDEITSFLATLEDEFLSLWGESIFVNSSIPLDNTQLVLEVASGTQLKVSIFPPTGLDLWSSYNATVIQFVLQNQDVWLASIGPMTSSFITPPYINSSSQARGGLSKYEKLGIGIGASVMGIVIIVLGICTWKLRRRAEQAEKQAKPFASWINGQNDQPNIPQLKGARWFSFDEIRQCTNNFSINNEIGSGGYGKVYKGILANSGDVVAIKRSNANSLQGVEEFKNEIELLSRVHHRNLVGLIGFCFEEGEQMLVYKYMPNGTLREALTGKSGIRMDWNRRIELALGAAKGLAYLHNEAYPPIIHRDIKSSNILLDETLVAMVADFGLSKPTNEEEVINIENANIKGTMGYLDPNYLMHNELTSKSDVYSFGVTLLELVTGRLPIEEGKYMVYEVKSKVLKGGVDNVVPLLLDSNLIKESYPKKGMTRLVDLALKCLLDDPTDRPTMVEVCRELEQISLINNYGSWNKAKDDVEVEDKSPSRNTNLIETNNYLPTDGPNVPTDISSSFYYSGSGISIMTRSLIPK